MTWETWSNALKYKSWKAEFNFLLSIYEKSKNKSKLRSKPYLFYIDSVSYCNLQCPFCPTGAKTNDRDRSKLGIDQFKHLMDHMGDYLYEIVFCNWAEPFLNDDVPDMIRYAKKFHTPIRISSNLSIPLSRKKAKNIITSGFEYLTVSADGATQESYEKYRVGGNLELIFKNIKLINELKKELGLTVPILEWQFIVFKHNEHEIELATKIAKELDIPIRFASAYVIDSVERDDWVPTTSQYSQNIPTVDLKEEWQKNPISDYKKDSPCRWLWSAMVFGSDLSVSPCDGIINTANSFGKFDTLKNTWNNNKFVSAREFFKTGKVDPELICCKCPVKWIQEAINHYDDQILIHIIRQNSRFKRFFLKQYIKIIDSNLYERNREHIEFNP